MLLLKPAAAGVALSPWNSADMYAGVALSTTAHPNDTAAVSSGSSGQAVRTLNAVTHTNGSTADKYHVEVQIVSQTVGGGWAFGGADSTQSLSAYVGQSGGHSFCIRNVTLGNIYAQQTGNFTYSWGTAYSVGDWFAMEIDLWNKMYWWKNITKATGWAGNTGNDYTRDPTSGTDGAPFSASTVLTNVMLIWSGAGNGGTDKIILRTSAADFTSAVSSGYRAWDY